MNTHSHFLNIKEDSKMKRKTFIFCRQYCYTKSDNIRERNVEKQQRNEERKCWMTTNSYFHNIKGGSKKQRKIYCYYSNYCYHKEQ